MTPDSPSHPPRRRWFRVSVRGLMILVVVAAIAVGWVGNSIRESRRAIHFAESHSGQVGYDFQREMIETSPNRKVSRSEPAAPRWIRRWLGDELFQSVTTISIPEPVPDTVLPILRPLNRLQSLYMRESADRGADFERLQRFTHLYDLQVMGSGVDDVALAKIAEVGLLSHLNLQRVAATDAGFARLGTLRNLSELTISSASGLTDAGGARLFAILPPLHRIWLGDCPGLITATLESLADHHPDLQYLTLRRCDLTPADLAIIARLGKLRTLAIRETALTAADLTALGGMRSLKQLDISGTQVTQAETASLKQVIPSLRQTTNQPLAPESNP